MRSGLLLLDGEEQVAYSNPSAERLLGISLGDMLDQPIFDVRKQLLSLAANPDHAQTELDRLWQHAELPGHADHPERPDGEQTTDLALADAAVRWLRIHTFLVSDGPGHIQGRGILLDDITLERDAMQVRSETLALAAHELKTPLAVIKGCATTLIGNASRLEPTMLREMLQMIDANADHLHDVLNTLLDVWRLDAGVQQLRLAEVRLSELVARLVERMRKNAPRHTFTMHVPEETVRVQCDVLRLEQALVHLLTNAVAYSPVGSTITIRLETNEDDVRLSITDQGVGIAPEHLEHIFTRFYRVPRGEGRPAGNGLGLAVARATIEAHGGRIWAESGGRGKGTIFFFTLPRIAAQVPSLPQPSFSSPASLPSASPAAIAPDITSPSSQPSSGQQRGQQRASIVIVEQDPRMSRYLRAHLEEQRYQVHSATHGLQFLRQLDLQEPELVLLASDVGDMTGRELLERLREFSRVPVLMLCNSSEDEDARVRYLDSGADDFVVKPFSIKELLGRVRVLLRRRPSRSDADDCEPLFTTGEMVIDYAQRQVFIHGRAVQLSRTEYKLLSVLAQNAGRVMTHELLLERVWGAEYSREVDFIWVYISRLRRKVEADPRHPRFIVTVPDVGYKLVKL